MFKAYVGKKLDSVSGTSRIIFRSIIVGSRNQVILGGRGGTINHNEIHEGSSRPTNQLRAFWTFPLLDTKKQTSRQQKQRDLLYFMNKPSK